MKKIGFTAMGRSPSFVRTCAATILVAGLNVFTPQVAVAESLDTLLP